uniref:Uncharacterized protein n=1 Tax=Haemonchus contortus TaxID=6289 RepID=W6NFW8_HAECO
MSIVRQLWKASGLAPSATRVLIISSNTISCLVIIVYTAIIIFVKTQGKSVSCRSNRQIIRRISVIVLIFICVLLIDLLLTNILCVYLAFYGISFSLQGTIADYVL